MHDPLLAYSVNRRYTWLFALMAASLLALTAVEGGFGLVLLWPAGAFTALSLAYCGRADKVLAKDGGVIPWSRRLALLPFFVLVQATWGATRRVSKEDAFNHVNAGLVIGRRPRRGEIPAGIRTVVDLTAEFDGVRGPDAAYASFPILDAAPLPPPALAAVVAAVRGLPRPWFIHCAQGHGRTSMVAAALLVEDGNCSGVAEALDLVANVRPAARPNQQQLAAMLQWERMRQAG